MDNRQLPVVPERLQQLQRGMQRKAAIQVDSAIVFAGRRHGDRRAQLVIAFFEKRHDDVQTVSRAALKDRHQDLPFAFALRGSAKQPRGSGAEPGGRNGRGTKKVTSCDHSYRLWKSGELMTTVTSIEGVASWR